MNIVCGMEALHKEDIIHRDLKPENILLDRQHCARIADFGLSWFVEDGSPSLDSAMRSLYPEANRRSCDKSVDVYAFGMILYEIVNVSTDLVELNTCLREGRRPSLSKLNRFTAGLINRCWDKDPTNRPTFETIRNELTAQKYQILANVQAADVETVLRRRASTR
jgi:serine/threonine protein kinase